ncbi:AI-2E family transporter [Alkalibaculum sp. M08DMB]|uniref:AI-2E family transporter n=1 Tax=Alkalibaculum sporogenes TaxID=2655001 RepID=A0A6A7KDM5_9FIRM|nr:AI-2E family transporter [Alkalibaculum sporogenes]MPW27123.1 AI-2E family transporter [Alkalibaculum sporogenes]
MKRGRLGNLAIDTQKGVIGYIKAQIYLMGITFLVIYIGLNTFGVAYSLIISLGLSILDIIPVIGIGLVLIPWSIISFIMGNTDLGTHLAIIYILTVILRQILEPILVGKHIGIRPIYIFIATVIGFIILGPIGLIFGPIFAIILKAIVKNQK